MTDLVDKIKQIRNFGAALENGLHKTIQTLPIIARQQINAKAKTKLHSTLGEYMDAVQTRMDGYVFIIELDKDSWIANAVEVGVNGFDMKKGFFNSPKARVGKDGSKYLRIPMGKDVHRKPETVGTEKSQEYQKLIQQVMNKPKFGARRLKNNIDGSLIESQKLLTDEPKLQGFYRFRKFDSKENYFSSKGRGTPFQHVMFRTVSEKGSKTGAVWQHPGIRPANILKQVERELPQIFATLLDNNIRGEFEALMRS